MSSLLLHRILTVKQEDINCFLNAKKTNQYVNIVNTNMIDSVLKRTYPDEGILVLQDRVHIRKTAWSYLYSNPIYFDDILKERLKLFDNEEFDKLEPFELDLKVWHTTEVSLKPYVYTALGFLECLC